MSIDWYLIRKQRIETIIREWLDSSHEGVEKHPGMILSEAILAELRQIEAEEMQYTDEMNSHYQSEGQPDAD